MFYIKPAFAFQKARRILRQLYMYASIYNSAAARFDRYTHWAINI
jgi:hypothetical protein